jgi:hypothetical protein
LAIGKGPKPIEVDWGDRLGPNMADAKPEKPDQFKWLGDMYDKDPISNEVDGVRGVPAAQPKETGSTVDRAPYAGIGPRSIISLTVANGTGGRLSWVVKMVVWYAWQRARQLGRALDGKGWPDEQVVGWGDGHGGRFLHAEWPILLTSTSCSSNSLPNSAFLFSNCFFFNIQLADRLQITCSDCHNRVICFNLLLHQMGTIGHQHGTNPVLIFILMVRKVVLLS